MLFRSGNVPAQAALIDYQLPPNTSEEVALAHDLRRALCECHQNVERSAANLERTTVLLEDSLGCTKPKGAERCDPTQEGRTAGSGELPFGWGSGRRCHGGVRRVSGFFFLPFRPGLMRVSPRRATETRLMPTV